MLMCMNRLWVAVQIECELRFMEGMGTGMFEKKVLAYGTNEIQDIWNKQGWHVWVDYTVCTKNGAWLF